MRYLSAFIYTTSFSTVFRWEGPFMNGRRKCELVAYDAILDRYAVLYIQRQSRLLMIYIKRLVWKLLSFLSFIRRQELCWNTLRKYQSQYLLSSCLKISRLPWGRETTASRRERVVGAFVKNHGTLALVTHNTFHNITKSRAIVIYIVYCPSFSFHKIVAMKCLLVSVGLSRFIATAVSLGERFEEGEEFGHLWFKAIHVTS